MTVILDPTDERVPIQRKLAQRNGRLVGSLALLDISKPRGDVFLGRVARVLARDYPGLQIRRYVKPTYTRPAPADLRKEISQKNQYVIEALAD